MEKLANQHLVELSEDTAIAVCAKTMPVGNMGLDMRKYVEIC